VIESGFIIFRVTHNKWWIVEIQGIGWPKWDPSLVLIWTSSSTTCFNSHWLPQRTPQLPLVTLDHLCPNCKHAVSTLGLKIGVAERLWLQLSVITLAKTSFARIQKTEYKHSSWQTILICKTNQCSLHSEHPSYKSLALTPFERCNEFDCIITILKRWFRVHLLLILQYIDSVHVVLSIC
jgi:hypothetical protein